MWWYILLLLEQKLTAKSVGERILKINQYLEKLEAKVEWYLFPGTWRIHAAASDIYLSVSVCYSAVYFPC